MEDIKWLSDSEILKHIGLKIREWRLEENLSQQTVAKRAKMALITFQNIEHGKGGSFVNHIRVLRVLDHLDALSIFLQPKQISPIEFQRFEQGLKERQRARKKNHAADIDSTPVW